VACHEKRRFIQQLRSLFRIIGRRDEVAAGQFMETPNEIGHVSRKPIVFARWLHWPRFEIVWKIAVIIR
jgi:hypothetical protein